MAKPTVSPKNTNAAVKAGDQPDEPEVVRIDPERHEKVNAVHLFSIGDTDYFCPAEVPPNASLRMANIMRKQGEVAAMDYALEMLLGPDAHEALMDADGLTEEAMAQIMEMVSDIMLGKLERTDPKVTS